MTIPLNAQIRSEKDALDWCSDYVFQHRENFEIASRWFLPHDLREAYCALYAFARGADDRADEFGDDSRENEITPSEALDEWQRELDSVYDDIGQPSHTTFIALNHILSHYPIEKDLFQRMLDAFQQDQQIKRYETWQDVRRYTVGSADPVGRWVLRLHGYNSPAMDRWSDAICTGLQLANFLQDVREDYELRDRIYLPQEDMRRFGVTEKMLVTFPTPEPLRSLIQHEVARAEHLFSLGKPLLDNVNPQLKRQLILFHGGGRLALHALRQADYDVAGRKIKASKISRFALMVRALRGIPL
jgi:squalene synthase HpnC